MMRSMGTSAFADLIDALIKQFSMSQVIGFASLSDTLGALFAQLVLGQGKK